MDASSKLVKNFQHKHGKCVYVFAYLEINKCNVTSAIAKLQSINLSMHASTALLCAHINKTSIFALTPLFIIFLTFFPSFSSLCF